MGVYNDMANDAGCPYGSDENQQMADMIEADHRRKFQENMEEWVMKKCNCETWIKYVTSYDMSRLYSSKQSNVPMYFGQEIYYCPWCGKKLIQTLESTKTEEN